MKKYDIIVIGFGKAGKTLAVKMVSQGKKVALVEQSKEMFGGTCINIGCIPTKSLIAAVEKGLTFEEVINHKDTVVTRLRQKNFMMIDSTVDLYQAKAKFIDNKTIELNSENEVETLNGDIIVINTGAVSNVLPIEGLSTTQFVYDSTGIQQLTEQPKRLGVIGAGNIGLEFSTLYAKLGSQVTIFDPLNRILIREEEQFSTLAKQYMEDQGIQFKLSTKIDKVFNIDNQVCIQANGEQFMFDAVLYATGRVPSTKDLNLESTDIQTGERGEIIVDEFCQTHVENVFAVGDVNGGPQFTYTSLDDFRIVFGYLNGDTTYSLKNRLNLPNTTFINPPISRVGLNEDGAKTLNLPYAVKEMPVMGMPRAHVDNDLRGLFKVIVNTETKEILGATLLGNQSHELINIITMAMDNHIPYTYFTKQLFTHPTMAENFNDLFAI